MISSRKWENEPKFGRSTRQFFSSEFGLVERQRFLQAKRKRKKTRWDLARPPTELVPPTFLRSLDERGTMKSEEKCPNSNDRLDENFPFCFNSKIEKNLSKSRRTSEIERRRSFFRFEIKFLLVSSNWKPNDWFPPITFAFYTRTRLSDGRVFDEPVQTEFQLEQLAFVIAAKTSSDSLCFSWLCSDQKFQRFQGKQHRTNWSFRDWFLYWFGSIVLISDENFLERLSTISEERRRSTSSTESNQICRKPR